jgi:hypothetical protein
MLDRKYIDLINRAIDGEIEPGEQKILDNLLTSEPEARRLYDLFRTGINEWQDEADVEPPAGLKTDIMNAIDPLRYQKKNLNGSERIWLFSFIKERKIRMALAMAAGLILGICLYPLLFTRPEIDPAIYGTIGVEQSDVMHLKSIKLDHVAGTIDLKQARQMIWLQFNLNTEQNLDVDIHYVNKNLYPVAIHPLQSEDLDLNISANTITLSTHYSFALIFRRRVESLNIMDVSVQTNGEKRQDIRLEINPEIH